MTCADHCIDNAAAKAHATRSFIIFTSKKTG